MPRTKLVYMIALLGCAVISVAMIWRATLQRQHSLEEQGIYVALSAYSESVSADPVWASLPSTCGVSEVELSAYPTVLRERFLLANGPWSRPTQLTALQGRAEIAEWGGATSMTKDRQRVEFDPAKRVVWTLSRAGFDEARSRALACVEEWRSGTVARATLFEFEKRAQHWRVKARKRIHTAERVCVQLWLGFPQSQCLRG